MRNILDKDYALVQNLLAYLEGELRAQPEKSQLADLCRIAVDTLRSEGKDDLQSDYEPCKTLIDVRFSISGPSQFVSRECE